MNIITLDTETVPTSLQWVKDEIKARCSPKLDTGEIKAPSNWKDTEKIKQYIENAKIKREADNIIAEAVAYEDYDNNWKKTALDTSLAEIVCLGCKINDEPVRTFYRPIKGGASEASLLESFWQWVYDNTDGSESIWVTFNGNNYDIPLLWKRSKINRVPMTKRINPHPRHGDWRGYMTYFDVMLDWCGQYSRERISMDRLCKLFGIEGKTDMTGKDVLPAMLVGDHDKVAAYCADDVERTWQLYNFIK